MALNPNQQRMANQLFGLGRSRGLSPQRAKEFVAAAYAESGLNPQATNKSSGAAGLFQLLSSGYRTKAQKMGGVYNPRANALAILPDYINYWKTHPGAAPGAAGRDVERSGMGADFYSGPLRLLGQLTPAQIQAAQLPNAPVKGPSKQQVAAFLSSSNGGTPYDNAWSLRLMDRQPLGSSISLGQNFAQALLAGGFGSKMSTEGMFGALMQLRSDIENQDHDAGSYSVGGLDERIGPMRVIPRTTYSTQVMGTPTSAPVAPPPAGGGGGGGRGITELFYDPLGGIKNGRSIGAIGNHSDHVHVSMPSLQTQMAVEQQARRMGMHVGEEQDSTVDPVHVKTSYHYQNWPGTKWRKAADISGSPAQMAALYKWVNNNYGRR